MKKIFLLLVFLCFGQMLVGIHRDSMSLGNFSCFGKKVDYTRYRNNNRCPNCFLPGLSILGDDRSDSNFENAMLFHAEFTAANVNYSNFKKANLVGSLFCSSHANGSDFSEAKLQDAACEQAFFSLCLFDGATLNGANFYDTYLRYCHFNDTDFIGTNLNQAHLNNSTFIEANFTDANLSGATLTQATVKNCLFSDTIMKHVSAALADFSGSTFVSTKIYKSQFRRSLMRDTIWKNSTTYGISAPYCNFDGANMSNAIFIGADFRHSSFKNAKTDNSNFTDANFRDAKFFELSPTAILCNTTMPDGTINDSGCKKIDTYLKALTREAKGQETVKISESEETEQALLALKSLTDQVEPTARQKTMPAATSQTTAQTKIDISPTSTTRPTTTGQLINLDELNLFDTSPIKYLEKPLPTPSTSQTPDTNTTNVN